MTNKTKTRIKNRNKKIKITSKFLSFIKVWLIKTKTRYSQ